MVKNLNRTPDYFRHCSASELRSHRFLARREFLSQNYGTEAVLLPPKNPNLNTHVERRFRNVSRWTKATDPGSTVSCEFQLRRYFL